MPAFSIMALNVVVTIAFLLLVYAPPRREHAPGARPVEEKPPESKPREPKRKSSTTFEGEQILHKTYRHWMVLLVRGLAPLLILAFFGGLAFYRWIGGQFIVADVTPTGQISAADVLLVLFIAITLLLWRRSAVRRKKDKKYKPPFGVQSLPDISYLVVVAVLALILFFRFQGGRIFYIDPFSAGQSDSLNGALVLIAFVASIWLLYIFLDWRNDFLILTPTRVIYDDTQLLIRRVQQEIVIDNIQQSNVRADSYIAYLLGYIAHWRDTFLHFIGIRDKPSSGPSAVYAKIIIGSFSPQSLIFDYADRPYEMQSKIQGEVNKLRKQQDADALRRMIENQVYENKPPKAAVPDVEVDVHEGEGLLAWFHHPNPEVKKEGDFYALTWRPVKWFMLRAIARPYITFLLPALVLWAMVRLSVFPTVWAFLLVLLIAIPTLIWGLWIREEHENDKFILNIREIVDVDKKPLGPESSRRAPLSAIQNIEFDVGVIERILGYGDVIITTAGGAGHFTFEHVPDPRGVQATINNYLSYFKKSEKERALKSTLDVLQQYHKLQVEHGELMDNQQLPQAVSDKLIAYVDEHVPRQVANEVATRLPQQVHRQVRQELWRNLLARRRRPSRGT